MPSGRGVRTRIPGAPEPATRWLLVSNRRTSVKEPSRRGQYWEHTRRAALSMAGDCHGRPGRLAPALHVSANIDGVGPGPEARALRKRQGCATPQSTCGTPRAHDRTRARHRRAPQAGCSRLSASSIDPPRPGTTRHCAWRREWACRPRWRRPGWCARPRAPARPSTSSLEPARRSGPRGARHRRAPVVSGDGRPLTTSSTAISRESPIRARSIAQYGFSSVNGRAAGYQARDRATPPPAPRRAPSHRPQSRPPRSRCPPPRR